MARRPARKNTHHTSALRRLLPALTVFALVAAALCALAMYLRGFMVYSRSGAYLQLPGSTATEALTVEEAGISGLNIVEETISLTDSDSSLRGVALTAQELLTADLSALTEDTGCNALVIDMKGTDGVLWWVSTQSVEGTALSVSDSAAQVAQVLSQLQAQGITLIARLSLLEDEVLSHVDTLALEGCDNRLDPESRTLQTLFSLWIGELAELGFTQIVVRDFGYPTDYTGRSVGSQGELTATLLELISQSCIENGVLLGLEPEEGVLTTDGMISGLCPGALSALGDCLWCGSTDAALFADCPEQLVVWVASCFDAGSESDQVINLQ